MLVIYDTYIGQDYYWIIHHSSEYRNNYIVKCYDGIETKSVFNGTYENCKKYIDRLWKEHQIETIS